MNLSERYVIALNFLLVSVLAYFAALSVGDLLTRRLAGGLVQPRPSRTTVSVGSDNHPRSFYNVVVQRDVFNSVREQAAPTTVVSLDLHLKLLGTSQLTRSRPFAIVEDETNHVQSLFQLGDEIPNAGRLVAVEKERVIINHNGQNVALEIPREMMSAPAAPTLQPAALPRMEDEGIRKAGENQYLVERRMVDQNLQNMAALFTQMRAIPNLENGKSDGFKLSEIRAGSIFQQMGLLNGDIVKSVGGQEMNDPSRAMELLNMLRNQNSLTIDVVRNGKPLELSYEIR